MQMHIDDAINNEKLHCHQMGVSKTGETLTIPLTGFSIGCESGVCPICGTRFADFNTLRPTKNLLRGKISPDGTASLYCGKCLTRLGFAHHAIKLKKRDSFQRPFSEEYFERKKTLVPYRPEDLVSTEAATLEATVKEQRQEIGKLTKQIDDLNVKVSGLVDGRKMCEEHCDKVHASDLDTIRKLRKRIRYLENTLLDNSVSFEMEDT